MTLCGFLFVPALEVFQSGASNLIDIAISDPIR
jgi:hypothetical protein